MTLSLIGGHFTKNGLGANYPSRVCLSIAGNGLGEQHPDTIKVFRDVTVYNDGPPDLHAHPQRRTIEFARWWYQEIREVEDKPCLREVWIANRDRADFFVITNELGGSNPDHILDHIAFESNICQLAHADGIKCAVGKLAGDSPDWNTNLWEELYAPFIIEMWDKYGAIYARHVYGGNLVDSNGFPTNDPPGNPQRPFFEAYHLRKLGYGGGMVLAECGLDAGYGVADYGRFRAQVLGYAEALKPYADIIIGLCWWMCGDDSTDYSDGFDADYTEHLKMLRPSLDTSLPKWEGNIMTDKPKIVILKKPQKANMTEAENEAANQRAWNDYGRTATHSDDDMMTMLDNGNDESYAIVCWPERQPNTVTMLESAGYDWVMFPEEVPPPPQWTKLPIPHMSQLGTGASQRSNDCGAACVAMAVNGMTTNKPTVDQVAIAYQTPANSYMNFWQIDTALNGYGMDGTHKRPYMPDAISSTIAGGKPVIALVWYQSLPQKFSSFDGSHFVIVYGTNQAGNLLYRDPLATNGNELYITYEQLETAMRDAQNSGNYPNQGMDCVKKNDVGLAVDMLPYFSPPAGTPYGPVTIKDTNWGQGQVRQQVQSHGDYLYVTKGKEFEARKLIGDRIFFIADDSPGDGKYYVVQSNDGWIPRYFTEGQSFTRRETATFYYKSNCNSTGEASSWTNVIKFTKFYPTWQTPGGMSFSNVCHLQWLVNGVVEEDYYVAPHVGYVMWKNKHGRQSYVVDMPQGQGNNTFNGACYWPAFGKEW